MLLLLSKEKDVFMNMRNVFKVKRIYQLWEQKYTPPAHIIKQIKQYHRELPQMYHYWANMDDVTYKEMEDKILQ